MSSIDKKLILLIVLMYFFIGMATNAALADTFEERFGRRFTEISRTRANDKVADIASTIDERLDSIQVFEIDKDEQEEVLSEEEKQRLDQKGVYYSFKPTSFSYNIKRESNNFRSRTQARGELITTYGTSFEGVFQGGGWDYVHSYNMEYLEHRNFPTNDGWNHSIGHTLSRQMGKTYFEVSNTTSIRFIPASFEAKPATLRGNGFGTLIRHELGPKLNMAGFYRYGDTTYRNDILSTSNSQSNSVGSDLSYRLSPKTEYTLQYRFAWSRPKKRPETADINGQIVGVRVAHLLSPKLGFDIGAGLETTWITNPNINISGHKTDWYLQGAAKYRLTPKIGLTWTVAKGSFNDTPVKGAKPPTLQSSSLALSYPISNKIRLRIFDQISINRSAKISTALDPDIEGSSKTKRERSFTNEFSTSLGYYPTEDIKLVLKYTLERTISDLKLSNSTNHISEFTFKKDF